MNRIVSASAIQHVGASRNTTVQKSSQRGQGMTEYIIIVALIAVAAIGVYQLFGQVVRSQTAAIANEVGGVDSTTQIAKAVSAGTAASSETGKKGLDSYGGAKLAPGAGN
jgi:type IV pilus assembly protein PilA